MEAGAVPHGRPFRQTSSAKHFPASPVEQVAALTYQPAIFQGGTSIAAVLNYLAVVHGTMNRTSRLLLICLLLVPACTQGQQLAIDSLLRQLPLKGPDTGRVNLLNKVSWMFWETGQYDSTYAYATAAKDLAARLDFQIGIAQAYNELGLVQEYRGDLAGALDNYSSALAAARLSGSAVMAANCYTNIGILQQKQGDYAGAYGNYAAAMDIYTEAGNEKGIAISHINLGYVNSLQGNYPEALDHYYAALKIQNRLGNQRSIADIYTNIGIIHFRRKNYTEALKDHEAALAIRQRIDDREGMAINHSNLGMVYQGQGEYGQALEHYQEALALDRAIGNARGIANDHANIGGVYAAQGNSQEAMGYLQTALQLNDDIGDQRGVCGTYLALGAVSLDLHKPREARTYFGEALRIGRSTNAKEDLKSAYQGLAMADSALGDPGAALENYKLYALYKDSLFNEENTRKLTQATMAYEFGKQALADSLNHAAEQRTMGAQLEREKTVRNAVIALALALAAGGGLWLWADRKRRKERFHKEVAELETQVLRTQMNPHFIFNALNSINAYVQRNDRDGASVFLSRFARVMRGVLENSRYPEITLEDDLRTLRGYMDLERLRLDGKFDYTIRVDPALDPSQVMVPPLAVQPLVENAIWHGLAHKDGQGHITMDIRLHGNHLSWSVEDDGTGRQAVAEAPAETGPNGKKTSMGMAITRNRLALLHKQYGGPVGLRYEEVPQGTRAVVDLPVIPA